MIYWFYCKGIVVVVVVVIGIVVVVLVVIQAGFTGRK
jgi:hypothetical protein